MITAYREILHAALFRVNALLEIEIKYVFHKSRKSLAPPARTLNSRKRIIRYAITANRGRRIPYRSPTMLGINFLWVLDSLLLPR